jgi:transposase
MNEVTVVGLDIAKNIFQVHAVDATGAVVLRQRLARGRVLRFFARLPKCLVGIEACATSHYWARELLSIAPHYAFLVPPPAVPAEQPVHLGHFPTASRSVLASTTVV